VFDDVVKPSSSYSRLSTYPPESPPPPSPRKEVAVFFFRGCGRTIFFRPMDNRMPVGRFAMSSGFWKFGSVLQFVNRTQEMEF